MLPERSYTTRNILLLIVVLSLPAIAFWFWPSAFRELVHQWQERYELRQDKQGRLIRLDKATGDMMIVEGTRLVPIIPVKPLTFDSDPLVRLRTNSALLQSKTDISTGAEAERELLSDAAATRGLASPGQFVTIVTQTPLFVTANRNQTPLTVFPKSTTLKVLAVEGGWYQVEFDDPRWGRRVGFVDQKSAVVSASENSHP